MHNVNFRQNLKKGAELTVVCIPNAYPTFQTVYRLTVALPDTLFKRRSDVGMIISNIKNIFIRLGNSMPWLFI